MYFIMRGEMRMMDESLKVCYNVLYSGAYFGELAMLTGQPRTATALAVTDCVLFYINQHDFNTVAHKWPKALTTILSKAADRLSRVSNSNSQARHDT
jgi:trk system potassium uptake protein TrkA